MQVKVSFDAPSSQTIARWIDMQRQVDAAMFRDTVQIVNDFKVLVEGDEYLSRFPPRPPFTKSPAERGEPPGRITGDLSRSFEMDGTTQLGVGRFTKQTFTRIPYAAKLEWADSRSGYYHPFMGIRNSNKGAIPDTKRKLRTHHWAVVRVLKGRGNG